MLSAFKSRYPSLVISLKTDKIYYLLNAFRLDKKIKNKTNNSKAKMKAGSLELNFGGQ